MQTQVRPPRQRSSGGRTLMLLGLVLALAAAGLVLYVTSSVQGTFTSTVSVVVAAKNLSQGTILTLTNTTAPDMRIVDAFTIQQMDKKLVPADAYAFTNQDALNTVLNNQVVKDPFLAGDILRTSDPRLAQVGLTSGNSLTNLNPTGLPNGSVLYTLPQKNVDLGLQPGDTIDIIATGLTTNSKVGSQFVLSKILVYAVDVPAKDDIVVVVTDSQVLLLTEAEHANLVLTIVIRKPGDPTNPIANPPNPGP
jgi:Flp pilus assembly protein CpaB